MNWKTLKMKSFLRFTSKFVCSVNGSPLLKRYHGRRTLKGGYCRQKRRQELSILASKAIHGKVYPISKPDYSRAVTDASKQYPVLLHLASSSHGNLESRLLSELWRWAAEKFPEIKFCEIVGSMCIENYPDKNCPTILVYKDGELEKNSVGLGEMKGSDTRLSDLEAWMVGQGVLKGDDIRLRDRRNEEDKSPESHGVKSGSSRRAAVENDSDDDWD
jgi:hypothetical protein